MKVTQQDIDLWLETASVDYYKFPNSNVTICQIKLHNGFCLVGTSACVDSDASIGADIAFKDAQNKLWDYLGWDLANRLWKMKV